MGFLASAPIVILMPMFSSALVQSLVYILLGVSAAKLALWVIDKVKP